MLSVIKHIDQWVKEIIKDDPVRSELPAEFRINESSEMFALWSNENMGAICCVTYTDDIPESIEEMDWLELPWVTVQCSILYGVMKKDVVEI